MVKKIVYGILGVFGLLILLGVFFGDSDQPKINRAKMEKIGVKNWTKADYDRFFKDNEPPRAKYGSVNGPVRYLIEGVNISFGRPTLRIHGLMPPVPNLSDAGAGSGFFYSGKFCDVDFSLKKITRRDGSSLDMDEISSARVNQCATAPPAPGLINYTLPGYEKPYLNLHAPITFEENSSIGHKFESIKSLAGTLKLTLPTGLTQHEMEVSSEGSVSHEGVEVSYTRNGDKYYFDFSNEKRLYGLQALDDNGNPVGLHSAKRSSKADWEVHWRRNQPKTFKALIAKNYHTWEYPFKINLGLGRIAVTPDDVGESFELTNGQSLSLNEFSVGDEKSSIKYSPSDISMVGVLGEVRGKNSFKKESRLMKDGLEIREPVDRAHLYYRWNPDGK
ncbi:MAG: hypothetical protein ABEK50_07695 [bacterium]